MSIFNKTDILIPKKGTDLSKWSVVACDQYTSEPEYWQNVKNTVGDSPSALNIIFPEAFLSEGDERINRINKTMSDYLKSDLFDTYSSSLIYIERTQRDGRVRKGLIGAVDLEEYDFHIGSKSKIRATEGTVLERIPPRVKIRENAPLELPHIMLLMDDVDMTVIEPLKPCNKIYDFDLMQGGGHLTGYLLTDDEASTAISAIEQLNSKTKDGMLFAVGDGNHSLATAKTCWENIKKTLSKSEIETHPARFCLVEIENIHSKALDFEPIHRIVFGKSCDELLNELRSYYPDCSDTDNKGQHIEYITGDIHGDLYIQNPDSALAVGTLQAFLDAKGCKVDYIHGADTLNKLAQNKDCIGFLLPAMKKSELFPAVSKDGALPRKTFSMGEAHDKKFYLEARKIQ